MNISLPTCSRRSLLQASRAVGLAFVGWTVLTPTRVMAAPTVTVAVPHIDLIAQCRATISVEVTCETLVASARYLVFGDLLEADDREEDTDVCGRFDRQVTMPDAGTTQTQRLTCHVWAEDIGLMRGVGPAQDETDPADDIELVARIWVRQLITGETFGPWDSPQMVVFTNAWLTTTIRTGLDADTLRLPRPDGSPDLDGVINEPEASRPAPPQSCLMRRP